MSDFEKWFAGYHSNNEAYAETIASDAWNARQSEIDQLKKQLNDSEYLKEEHRKRRCELAKEIDQLKAKNKALTHALVNTNAEKTKWAHSYWSQVERTAEYGAMLISSDSELTVLCFKKEKEIEKLKAENKRLSGLLKEQKRCFDECSQMTSDLLKERDQLKAEKEGLEKAIDNEIKRCLDSTDAPIRDEHDKGWRNAMLTAVSGFKRLRGEHE